MGDSSLSNKFFEDTQYLLGVDFVQSSLWACALLGILSGVMTSLIVLRQMSFSVHATSELALMGASAALLFGFNLGFGAIAGAIVAAIILAVLGLKGQQDSAIGVVMSFGLGLSVLFLHLYPGNSNTAMTLLTGQIVGVSAASVWLLALTTVIIVGVVLLFWRPLLFASADPVMAQAMRRTSARYLRRLCHSGGPYRGAVSADCRFAVGHGAADYTGRSGSADHPRRCARCCGPRFSPRSPPWVASSSR